eukprot:12969706-Alexandrium_andersonii.AAC.1
MSPASSDGHSISAPARVPRLEKCRPPRVQVGWRVCSCGLSVRGPDSVSYTHLRAHETSAHL